MRIKISTYNLIRIRIRISIFLQLANQLDLELDAI